MTQTDSNKPPGDSDLTGQTAWVTGAARGIGAATAQELARLGASVFLSDVLTTDPVVDAITSFGGQARSLPLDITDAEACALAASEILSIKDSIDILICNAGVCPAGPITGNHQQWVDVLNVNLHGTRNCIEAVWPTMEAQQGGILVLVSSMAYYQGGVIVGPEYTASKAALVGMTRHYARNGGPLGIRCNAVAPGIIATDMTRDFDKPDLDRIPLGRLGTAQEVAGPITFLCQPQSAYMTGTVLNITGGMILAG